MSTITQFPSGNTQYRIEFDYLARTFIVVTLVNSSNPTMNRVLEVGRDYRFLNPTMIEMLVDQSGFDIVRIHRQTGTDLVVDFRNGSVLTASALTNAELQAIHIAEEGRDQTVDLAKEYADAAGSSAGNAKDSEDEARRIAERIKAAGLVDYITRRSFEKGFNITAWNEALLWEEDDAYYRWDGTLPKNVPAGSTPETSGGIGLGAWVSVGDASLRSALAGQNGVDLVNGAAKQTDVDLINSQLSAFSFIEDYAELVVDGDWSDAINAAFQSGKPVIGVSGRTYPVSKIINSKGQKCIGDWSLSTSRYSLGAVNIGDVYTTDKIKMLYLESAYDLTELLFIRNLGFTTINHYGYFDNNGAVDSAGNVEQLLNNAATAGLKVILGTENSLALGDLGAFVSLTQNHQATYGYSVYDEPASRGITIIQQDQKIDQLKGFTSKPLSFVDYISDRVPFNQKFSTRYDLCFVNSYALKNATIQGALNKMRFDYGCVKAMSGVDRAIPCVSLFLDAGMYANDQDVVIGSSSIFGSTYGGEFAAFVWDGVGDANITSNVRNNAAFQSLAKKLCAYNGKVQYSSSILFGGNGDGTHWPLREIFAKSVPHDANSADVQANQNTFPIKLVTGESNTDRTINQASVNASGIGIKGLKSSYQTLIPHRKYARVFVELFSVDRVLSGTFKMTTSPDIGYTNITRYESGIAGNTVMDFTSEIGSGYQDTIGFDFDLVENSNLYRTIMRGVIVVTDW